MKSTPFSVVPRPEEPDANVKKSGEIAQMLDELGRRIDLLNSAVVHLEDALTPVISPKVDAPKDVKDTTPIQTPLGNMLLKMYMALGTIADRVIGIEERLAL